MKKILILLVISIVGVSTTIEAQQINGSQFNLSVIQEDFNHEGTIFPVVTTSDNYFILDNGDYLLSRNNQQSEYAILAKSEQLEDFSLKTSIRIGPSKNKTSSVGVIIKAQQDGKGAIIFEINKKQEYRIKQLVNNTYNTLSGKIKNDGWVKSKLIKGVDNHNFIEIRTANNIYDVFVNNSFLTTFFIPDYTNGVCGIIISPETKARVAYFYINKKGKATINNNTFLNTTNSETTTTIEQLNKKIKELEASNATLVEKNTSMMHDNTSTTEELNKKNTNLASINLEKKNEIETLNATIIQLTENNTQITVLESKNTENNDLITSLTNQLTALTKAKTELEDQLKIVQTKNATLVTTSMKQEKDTKHLNTVNTALRNKEDNLVITNKSLNDNITQLNKVIKDQKELQTALSTDLSSEKTAHNKTKQDLNKSITLNTKKITTAVKEGNALKKKITSLSNSKKIAESALTKEKNSHNKENKELHALINKKRKEITNLSDQIDQLNQVLITEKENSKKVKNCALNVTALSKELAKKNKKITSLEKIQTQHNSVVAQKNKNISNLSKHNKDLQVEVEILKTKTGDQQKTNKELKQLFVYKDFEVNGVKPSEVLKSNKKIYPTPKELKNQNQIYAVQFGVFMQIQPYATLKRLEDVWYETTEHGTYVYLSGQFTSPEKATVHKNTLVKLGYPNAFVVQLAK